MGEKGREWEKMNEWMNESHKSRKGGDEEIKGRHEREVFKPSLLNNNGPRDRF